MRMSGLSKVEMSAFTAPPGEDNVAQLFAQTRTLRIRQMDGLEISTDKLDLAAPDRGDLIIEQFS